MSRKRGESRTGALVDDKNKKSDGRREKRRAKVGRSSRGEKIKCAEEEAHEVKKEEEGREKESEKRRIEIKGLGGGRSFVEKACTEVIRCRGEWEENAEGERARQGQGR